MSKVVWLSRDTSGRKVEDRLSNMTDGSFVVVGAEVFDHPEAGFSKRLGTDVGPWCLGREDDVRAELARLGYEDFEIQSSAGMPAGEQPDG